MARVSAVNRRREQLGRKAASAGRSANWLFSRLPGIFLTVAGAIVLIVIANARDGVHLGPDPSVFLLAGLLVATLVILYLTSMSQRMRLAFQMVWIYMAIYLLLPGFHHASDNTFPIYRMHYPEDIRMEAAAMIAAFMIALTIGYFFGDQSQRIGRERRVLAREVIFPNKSLLIGFAVAAFGATVIYLAIAGFSGAFGLRGAAGAGVEDKAALGLLITLPRTVTFISFAYCYILVLRSQNAGIGIFFLLLNLPMFFITNYPLALPRYYLFGIILFFVVQTFDLKGVFARAMLTVLFLLGALFAMPFADRLTRHEDRIVATNFIQSFNDYLESGEFDGLQSIQNAVIYVDHEGLTQGNQMLSAAFFFVPRSIWQSKGEPTGVITSQSAGFKFNNISQPLPSEFYVDFGMIGVMALSLLMGFGLARVDGWIDRNWDSGPRAHMVAGIFVGFMIIFMRGTLLGIVPPVVVFASGVAVIIAVGLRNPEVILLKHRRAARAASAMKQPRRRMTLPGSHPG